METHLFLVQQVRVPSKYKALNRMNSNSKNINKSAINKKTINKQSIFRLLVSAVVQKVIIMKTYKCINLRTKSINLKIHVNKLLINRKNKYFSNKCNFYQKIS